MRSNPERVRQPPNPFRVVRAFCLLTQGSRKLEPWAEISERLRRYQPLRIRSAFGVNKRDEYEAPSALIRCYGFGGGSDCGDWVSC
jgi:hypothetical protein